MLCWLAGLYIPFVDAGNRFYPSTNASGRRTHEIKWAVVARLTPSICLGKAGTEPHQRPASSCDLSASHVIGHMIPDCCCVIYSSWCHIRCVLTECNLKCPLVQIAPSQLIYIYINTIVYCSHSSLFQQLCLKSNIYDYCKCYES